MDVFLKAHIICAKCGSTNVYFKIAPSSCEDDGSGVSICCRNCAELTAVEEWNEFNSPEAIKKRAGK